MVYAKDFKISRLFLILLVIVSMVALTSYTAPKARAEVATLTSVFLMLIMSVMASLGVSLAAQLLDQGIDYLHDQYVAFLASKGLTNYSIEDYLASIGINSISKLAVPIIGAINIGKTVYDAIAEFCSWFFIQNNVVSGGDPVGELPTVSSSMTATNTGYDYSGAFVGTNLSRSIPIYDDINDIIFNTSLSSLGSLTVAPGRQYESRSQNFNSTWIVGNKYVAWYAHANTSGYGQISNSTQLNLGGISSISGMWSANATGYQYSMVPVLLYDTSSNIYRVYFCRSSYSLYNSSSSFYIYSNLYIDLTKTNFDSYFNVPTTPGGFVVTPSANVISPPEVQTGQYYNIPVTGVTPSDSVETAVSTAVAPLTTTGGLSSSADVAGIAVSAEWEWLYEGIDAIEQNTSDDRHGTDFIPNNATVDFGFWHYVPDWISSVGTGFAFFVGLVTSLPSIMLAPLYGILVLGVVVALFHKLWGS